MESVKAMPVKKRKRRFSFTSGRKLFVAATCKQRGPTDRVLWRERRKREQDRKSTTTFAGARASAARIEVEADRAAIRTRPNALRS